MIKRPARHNRNRTALGFATQPSAASVGVTLSIDTGNCRIVFDAPVVARSLPLSITRQAAGAGPQLLPTGFNQVDALTVDLTYAAAVVATDVITIPANVPEIRGVAGGAIASTVVTF